MPSPDGIPGPPRTLPGGEGCRRRTAVPPGRGFRPGRGTPVFPWTLDGLGRGVLVPARPRGYSGERRPPVRDDRRGGESDADLASVSEPDPS